MNAQIIIRLDTARGEMSIECKELDGMAVATVLSQAVTQALMIDQAQRAMLVNPLNSSGVKILKS